MESCLITGEIADGDVVAPITKANKKVGHMIVINAFRAGKVLVVLPHASVSCTISPPSENVKRHSRRLKILKRRSFHADGSPPFHQSPDE